MQEAGGRRKENLQSKLFNLFQLHSYFRHAALAVPNSQFPIPDSQINQP